MSVSQKILGRAFCKNCNKEVKTEANVVKKKINHILHLLLSILTAGLWVIIWILLALNIKVEEDELPRCTECGSTIGKTGYSILEILFLVIVLSSIVTVIITYMVS